MKHILLIGLGGTIVCSSSGEGLVPKHSLKNLLSKFPKVNKIAKIETVTLMKRTIVFPKDWIKLAKFIANSLSKYDGFVITMGTDTLAYTSSMLSFMLSGLDKPVVITGAMIPIEKTNSDAGKNLFNSISFACESYGGVYVVFNGKVIKGCHVSKTDTTKISTFESINHPYFARIINGKITCLQKYINRKNKFILDTKINTNIVTIKLNPQISKKIFDCLSDYTGYIIEGYGDGNIPDDLIEIFSKLIRKGKIVVVASQCPYGKVEHRYRGGFLIIKKGAISSGNMTKETTVTKLMWCLGKSKKLKKINELMNKNFCDELEYQHH